MIISAEELRNLPVNTEDDESAEARFDKILSYVTPILVQGHANGGRSFKMSFNVNADWCEECWHKVFRDKGYEVFTYIRSPGRVGLRIDW